MRVSSATLFFWPVDNFHHHYLTTGIPPFPISSSSSSNSLRSSYMTTWSQISSKSADFALELCMHSLVLLFIQNNNGKAPEEKKNNSPAQQHTRIKQNKQRQYIVSRMCASPAVAPHHKHPSSKKLVQLTTEN